MTSMRNRLLFAAIFAIGPALVLGQAPGQVPSRSDPRAVVPGHPDWKGQTVQISPAPPHAERVASTRRSS